MLADGRGLMAFWSSIEPANQLAFRRWHNCEHIPERVSTPGFLRGRRYLSSADPERFLMFYETRDEAVLSSPAYLARLNAPTRRTREALGWFTKSTRSVFVRGDDSGVAGDWPAPVLVTARFDEAAASGGAEPAAIDPAPLVASGRFRRVRRYRLAGDSRSSRSSESAIHGAGIGALDGLLFAESTELDLLDVPEADARLRAEIAAVLGPARAATAEIETLGLEFALDSLAPGAGTDA